MHIQFDVSQVRSTRNRWPASSGSGNSTQMRGMSSGTSATRSAYADPPVLLVRGPCRTMAPVTTRIGLSTASMYPENCAATFATAGRLGYDGVEVMVWTDPVTQEPGARSEEHTSELQSRV